MLGVNCIVWLMTDRWSGTGMLFRWGRADVTAGAVCMVECSHIRRVLEPPVLCCALLCCAGVGWAVLCWAVAIWQMAYLTLQDMRSEQQAMHALPN